MESLLTQTLVIFVIRTRGAPWRSRPSRALATTVLVVGAVALSLPFTPVASYLGFEPPPWALVTTVLGLALAYLALAEVVKRIFYRHFAT
jgi:Mg2+-importing ATPase